MIPDPPADHPEYLTPPHHGLMEPYNTKDWPTCAEVVWDKQEFLNTGVGLTIRDLNSTLGLPKDDVATLLQDDCVCVACKCHFSFNGYHAHLRSDRLCANWPAPLAGKFYSFILSLRYFSVGNAH